MRHMRLTSTDSSMWINGTAASLLADCTRSVRICRTACDGVFRGNASCPISQASGRQAPRPSADGARCRDRRSCRRAHVPGRETSPSRRQHRECALSDGDSDLSRWLLFQHGIADGRALAPDGAWLSAEPTARFPGGGPQLDAGHGGLGDNGKVNIPYMWLEFGSVGMRLRGRRLVGRVVTPRDIPNSDITQLVVLAAPAGPRQRGIRLRTVGQPQYVYFFARPAVVQQIVQQFSCHGVRLDGQLASDRIPYSGGSWFYRESAPIQPYSE